MHVPSLHSWRRHFFYRAEHVRTTWKFRVGLAALIILLAWGTSGWWAPAIAQSLICERNVAPSDAILIENFDPEYLLFERARQLRNAGLAPRVLVPVASGEADGEANVVARTLAETMATLSRVGPVEIIAVREVEPISLNAARDVLRFSQREGIRSVIVVSPLFRSRRSELIYGATLGNAGVTIRCDVVEGTRDATTWTDTWHGIQNVAEQWLKLQYYRLYVLPFRVAQHGNPGSRTAMALHAMVVRQPSASRGADAR